MVTAKNKNAKKPVKTTKVASKNPAKPITLAIIGLAGLMVILATFSAFFFTPERVVKDKVETLAKEYYENTLYENIVNSTTKPLDEVMKKYAEKGFSRIFLRQLLVLSSSTHPDYSSIITSYCNENLTSIVIYPDAPYGKSDYHIEYDYSCKF